MKKIFLVIVAVIGFAISANAQERYQVSLNTYLQFVYENPENGAVLKSEKRDIKTITLNVCAKSEYNAINVATSDWTSQGYRKYEGETTINGIKCKIYSYRNVSPSGNNAKPLYQSCVN